VLPTFDFRSGFLFEKRQNQAGNRNKIEYLARISNAEDAALRTKRYRNY